MCQYVFVYQGFSIKLKSIQSMCQYVFVYQGFSIKLKSIQSMCQYVFVLLLPIGWAAM